MISFDFLAEDTLMQAVDQASNCVGCGLRLVWQCQWRRFARPPYLSRRQAVVVGRQFEA
jgi:hypothetical protein